jgi:formyl-CoA transferase
MQHLALIERATRMPRASIGEEGGITDEAFAAPAARLLHLAPIFARIEQWTMTKDKFEAMEILNQYDIPAGRVFR